MLRGQCVRTYMMNINKNNLGLLAYGHLILGFFGISLAYLLSENQK